MKAGTAMEASVCDRRSSGALPSRVALLATSLLYAWALHYLHETYLFPNWEVYGFIFFEFDQATALAAYGLVALAASVMPTGLQRPGALVLFALFVAVYVPAVVVSLGVAPDALDRYGAALAALGVGFGLACLLPRLQHAPRDQPGALPGPSFTSIFLGLWLVCCVVLLYSFGSIMRFVGEQDLYEQRELGAAGNLFLGYVQVTFSNILSPVLMAIGLLKRRWSLVLLGIAGCLIMFMINAQRTVFMLPFTTIGLYLLMTRRFRRLRTMPMLVLIVALVSLAACWYHNVTAFESNTASVLAQQLVFRSIAVPGLTFSQYQEVFGQDYTWWSHVRGISAFVPAPPLFANNPVWPGLGYLIGEAIHSNPKFNINANLFSGDGVAAAGPLGVIVIGLALGVWLWTLDRVSRGWDQRFVMLVLLPVALTLTNGHLTTTLLSYGGFFWTVVFLLYKPARTRACVSSVVDAGMNRT